MRRSAFGSPHMAGSFSMAIGSLWPHQMAIDGWWPSSSTAAAGLAHRLLADAAGVAPLQRQVLPEEQAALVGRVVELGAGDVGVDAEEVEAGVEGEVDVAGAARPAVASASAMRVGPWFEPLRKSRSPLTDAIQLRSWTWRRPVRSRRSSEVAPPSSAPSSTRDRDVVQRGLAERARPPQRRVGRP